MKRFLDISRYSERGSYRAPLNVTRNSTLYPHTDSLDLARRLKRNDHPLKVLFESEL